MVTYKCSTEEWSKVAVRILRCIYFTFHEYITSTVRGAEDVQGKHHGIGEGGGLLLTGKIQTIHLARVTPLVESRSGLIVFQALHYGVVDHHL